MQCYKNGQFIDSIPLLDRAFHYGDGCFTTARIFQENFELKELHFARLKLACQSLSLDVDLSQIEKSIEQLQQQLSCTLNIPATASATTALFNIRTTFYVLFATRNK